MTRRMLLPAIILPILLASGALSAQTAADADFDGDGMVGFSDFLLFVKAFRAFEDQSVYDAKFDLSQNGSVDFDDFVLFAKDYGK